MRHDKVTVGSPVVVYNRGATLVPAFPGAMIAPADATRRFLYIQADGNLDLAVYPRSGSDATSSTGIPCLSGTGTITLNDEEDPDLIVAEWWAYSATGFMPAYVAVVEEIFR